MSVSSEGGRKVSCLANTGGLRFFVMKLIKCPDCDEKISQSASSCPKCGCQRPPARLSPPLPMTKFAIWSVRGAVVSVAAFLVVFACNNWLSPPTSETGWQNRHTHFIIYFAFWFSLVCLLATIFAPFIVRSTRKDRTRLETLEIAIPLAFWTLAPPVYLFLEYWIFSEKIGCEAAEHLRHYQEITRNIWIAIVAVLAAIYTGKIPGASE